MPDSTVQFPSWAPAGGRAPPKASASAHGTGSARPPSQVAAAHSNHAAVPSTSNPGSAISAASSARRPPGLVVPRTATTFTPVSADRIMSADVPSRNPSGAASASAHTDFGGTAA